MSSRRIAPALVALACSAGCAAGNRIEAVDPVPSSAVVERLADGVSSAVPVPHHQLVRAGDDGLWLADPRGDVHELTTSPAPARAATRTGDGAVLVATDDDLLIFDAWAGTSGLAGAVSLPLTGLTADGDDLWVGTADGLVLWRDGWLHDVRVGRRPNVGPFAVGGGRTWLATSDGVAAVEEQADGFVVVASRAGTPVDALAVDGDGTAWIASGGALLRHDGDFTELTLPSPAVAVHASPGSPGAWVVTEDGLLFVGPDGALALDGVPAPEAAHVDEAGRLVVVADGTAWRVATARGGVVVGVDDGAVLDAPVEVLLQPFPADGVTAVEASLDGRAVEVLPEPWRVALDTDALAGATHTLTASATWTDGSTADLRPVRFRVAGEPVVTWDDDVGPIHERSCAVCHAGATETVLDGREAWQARIDDILEEVTARRMPLAGAKLTDAEIARIRAWKDGGFP